MRRAVVIAGLTMGCGPAVAPPLPTWDDVASHHPAGATNPPSPRLIRAIDTGACYKQWVGGMIRVTEMDHWESSCADDGCGTQIVCPDDADTRLGPKPSGAAPSEPPPSSGL
jgi:hypothetical protein